jgi:hypothetical protein
MATEEDARELYESTRKNYPKLDPWEILTQKQRAAWVDQAEKNIQRSRQERDLRNRVEFTDHVLLNFSETQILLSIAISLKRIADIMEGNRGDATTDAFGD